MQRFTLESVGFAGKNTQENAVLLDFHVAPGLDGRHCGQGFKHSGEMEIAGLVMGALAIHHYRGALQREHAADHDLIQRPPDKTNDLLGSIDDFHDHRNVVRYRPGRILNDPVIPASHDSAKHRRPGELLLSRRLDDSLVSGNVRRAVCALKVDPQ